RRDAAAARRVMGHAARPAQIITGLRPRCAEKPLGSPRDHAAARLWARQSTRGQGCGPEHPALSRSGGDADRLAQGNLYRWRARHRRDRQLEPEGHRRDYMVGLENTGTAVVDDPDQQFYESYACD